MKVIDFHMHIGWSDTWTPWVTQFFRENNPNYFQRFADGITPEKVIAFFASQGVDYMVMLAENAPMASGVIPNDFVAQFCTGHKELIPFGTLCFDGDIPYAEQVRYAVEEQGMKGFKFLPSYQHFYPNDPAMYPFYDYVQSRNLPVMFHTGISIFKGTRIKYADPLLLDDIAEDFPELTILMEHGGRSFWYSQAAWLITRHRNLHIGVAGIPIRNLPKYFPHLERYADRFVFGSDWPAMDDVGNLIRKVLELPYRDETKESILNGNAQRLLGMS